MTTHGSAELNSVFQTMDLNISGYKTQMIRIAIKTYYPKLWHLWLGLYITGILSALKSQSKLRTHSKYKSVCEVEPYILKIQSLNRNKLLASWEFWIISYRLIELGRHQKPSLQLSERTCPFCPNKIEDEDHSLQNVQCIMMKDSIE